MGVNSRKQGVSPRPNSKNSFSKKKWGRGEARGCARVNIKVENKKKGVGCILNPAQDLSMNKATSQPTVPVAGFCYETISTDIYIYNS
jgi:hypothetical protein